MWIGMNFLRREEEEINYKDGKFEGLHVAWYKNGQKKGENNWKDGKQEDLNVWDFLRND